MHLTVIIIFKVQESVPHCLTDFHQALPLPIHHHCPLHNQVLPKDSRQQGKKKYEHSNTHH